MNIELEGLNLDEFEGYGNRLSRKITITKAESFGFPFAFYNVNKLSLYKAVKLYFDRGNKVIGLKFLTETPEMSFKLVEYGGGDKKSAGFGARSFFNTYKLDVNKIHGKYDYSVKEVGGEKIFLIDLKSKLEELTSN